MSSRRPDSGRDEGPRLERALDAWRRDCAAARTGPYLAERVLARATAAESEWGRFRRLARLYAAAAALVAAAGGAGIALARRESPMPVVAETPAVADLEEARLERVGIDFDLAVGGK